MRFPWTRLYRAYPELDRFSDDQCEAWVKRAWRWRPWTMFVSILASAFLGMGLSYGLFRVLSRFFYPMAQAASKSFTVQNVILQLASVGGWVLLSAAPGLLGALVLRDLMLRRVIRGQLSSTRCMRCDYSLLGLPVREGVVTCSECGEVAGLTDRALAPEDLLSGRSGVKRS